MRHIIGLLLGGCLLTGCNALYDLAEAPYAERRVEALLAEKKLAATELSCTMMNTTRNFGCDFKLSLPDVERFVNAYGLVAGPPERIRQRYLHTLYPQNCEKHPPFDGDLNQERFTLYENKDRDFATVPGLYYLVVYTDRQTGMSCLQSAHTLGYE